MNKLFRFTLTATLLSTFFMRSLNAQPNEVPDASGKQKIANQFFESIRADKVDEAIGLMDSDMKQALPTAKVAGMWKSLESQLGTFQTVTQKSIVATKTLGQDTSIMVSKFQKGIFDITTTINSDGKVSGFYVRPHTEFVEPSYAQKNKFIEIPMSVQSGKFSLGATLSMPTEGTTHPAVVLVHGSGQIDRDETVGSIKVFRDLAWGLAARGIAVLRYEKRTRAYPHEPIANVNEETVDDAVAAVAALKKRAGIDPNRIVVLGHSLGAYMIPRIAAADTSVSAFVICAGPSQKLEDSLVDQIVFLDACARAADSPANSKEESKELQSIRAQVSEIKDLTSAPQSLNGPDILGYKRTWWLDVQNYDPVSAAKSIKKPLLILQGEKDYQITQKDFAGWQKAFLDSPDVKLKLYPGLSHCFTKAHEKPGPLDYSSPVNVSSQVITDISDWILALSK